MRIRRMNEIGPVYASLMRVAAAQVVFDPSGLRELADETVARVRSMYEEEEAYRERPFDVAGYLNQGLSELSGIPDGEMKRWVISEFTQIMDFSREVIEKQDMAAIPVILKRTNGLLRALYERRTDGTRLHFLNFGRILSRIETHLEVLGRDAQFIEKAVSDFRVHIEGEVAKSLKQAEEFKGKVDDFLRRAVPAEANLTVRITPHLSEDEFGSKVLNPIDFHVEMDWGHRNVFPPSMTVFVHDDKLSVDDVLSFGDDDFFTGDEDQSAYFDLVEYLRTGKIPGEEKVSFITLHRGMSNEEFMAWLSGETIPKGKFFTSSRTEQLAQDISGQFPELFTFRVRSDCVRRTEEETYQLITDCVMDQNKRITPVGR